MNYADNWSPGLDVKIMFKTVVAVRGGKRMLGYEELYIYGDKEKLDRLMNIMMKLQGVSGERNHIQLGRNVFLRTNADNNQGDIHAVS